jgi:signal transduction histidine kinase
MDTSTRVPLGSEGEEIENLAVTFNSMLDRIESLISDLRDVTDDIAHELRGPLTRIRGRPRAWSREGRTRRASRRRLR